MRFAPRLGITAGVLAVAVTLAGCGTSQTLLSQSAATQLSSELTQASTALNQYNCQVAYTALSNFRDDVGQLQNVNTTLVQMLSTGASTITALAQTRCPTGNATTTATNTTTTKTHTATTAPVTTTTVTTSPATVTTAPDTSTGTGGAAPAPAPTTATATPPIATATVPTATIPDSGGAGLGGNSGQNGQ